MELLDYQDLFLTLKDESKSELAINFLCRSMYVAQMVKCKGCIQGYK